MLFPVTAYAAVKALSEGAQTCLNCHAAPGMSMTLGDGTTVPIHVDGQKFSGSVHASMGCAGCHADISLDNHPSATYATKKQFLDHFSSACRTCHADAQLRANPLHQRVITRANAPPCSLCHSAHEIRNVASRKEKIGTSQYCLTCHARLLSRSIDGKSISLTIDEAWIKGSVHSSHECSDCHTAYSKEFHPAPAALPNIRALSLMAAESCKRCHFDKAVLYTDSIHAALSNQGVQQAPVCTDCHGAHRVGPAALTDTLDGIPCKDCHKDIFTAYRASIHGMRKSSGAGQSALCAGCHHAHDVKPAAASRSPRDMCLSCHPRFVASHQEWLPNPQAHLEMVACTACHVEIEDRRSIYLRPTDDATGKLLPDAEVRKLLDARGIAGRQIEPAELWWLTRKLNEGRTVSIAVAVSLDDPVHAHDITSKDKALRTCEGCHSAGSSFYDTVAITTAGPDGREVYHPVAPKVLGSAYSMLLLKRFYVMSGTRITAMDYAGAVIILGGLAVPVVHGAARLMTARLRRERKQRGEGRRSS
jgi:hypothetical protein